jgi:hypothetical protein
LEAYTAWIWERAVERLLIVLFSGGALILGWNLFKTGILLAQSAEFKAKGITAKLLNVGPGIFFALFGTVSLVVAALRPMTVDSTFAESARQDGKASMVEKRHTSYGAAGIEFDPLVGTDEIRSINSIDFIIEAVQSQTKLKDSDRDELKRAIGYLEAMKRRAVFDQYPSLKDRFDELDQNPAPDALAALSASDRKIFQSVKDLMDSNLHTPARTR